MSKRLGATLVILAVLVSGVVVCLRWNPAEPVRQGRTLSSWLAEGTDPGPMSTPETNTVAVVRSFGPGIVPTLLRMTKTQDSLFDRWYLKIRNQYHWTFLKMRTASDYHSMACFGFYSLGSQGKSAVPELTKMLETSNLEDHGLAADCLGNIGPDAEAAVPALLRSIDDPRRITCWDTTLNLGRIHARPELVVPILISELSPTNQVLATTISTLGSYGTNAKEAVPKLLNYVHDTNSYVRFETATALKNIDPAAAEKAGIK